MNAPQKRQGVGEDIFELVILVLLKRIWFLILEQQREEKPDGFLKK